MEIIRAAAVSRSPGLLLLLSIASSAIEGQGEAQAASDSALRADRSPLCPESGHPSAADRGVCVNCRVNCRVVQRSYRLI